MLKLGFASSLIIALICVGLSGCKADVPTGMPSEVLTLPTETTTVQATATVISLPTGHPCSENTIYPLLTWSPDGSKLAYGTGPVCCYDEGDVFTIDINTDRRTYLASYSSGGYPNSWSPDGNSVLLN